MRTAGMSSWSVDDQYFNERLYAAATTAHQNSSLQAGVLQHKLDMAQLSIYFAALWILGCHTGFLYAYKSPNLISDQGCSRVLGIDGAALEAECGRCQEFSIILEQGTIHDMCCQMHVYLDDRLSAAERCESRGHSNVTNETPAPAASCLPPFSEAGRAA